MSTAAKCRALAYLTILTLAPLHRCLAQSEADSTGSTGRKAVASPSNRTTDFLQRLADARVFSGTVAVQRGGSVVFNRGYGYAVEVSQIAEPVVCSGKPLSTLTSHSGDLQFVKRFTVSDDSVLRRSCTSP